MISRLDHHRDQAGAWTVLEQASGELAFDVGANIGQAAKVLHLGFKKVLAFEPCLESFDILQMEAPPNVLPINMAVWSKEGEIELEEHENSILTGQLTVSDGLFWGQKVGTRTVKAASMDYFTLVYGQPDFVKIDTEGSEVEVVKGGLRTLNETPSFIIEVHAAENEEPIRDLLPDRTFKKLEHDLRLQSAVRRNHFWLVSYE